MSQKNEQSLNVYLSNINQNEKQTDGNFPTRDAEIQEPIRKKVRFPDLKDSPENKLTSIHEARRETESLSNETSENDLSISGESKKSKGWFKYEGIKDINNKKGKRILIVIVLCFIFIILEIIGAYLSQSMAIFTDVAHLFSDLIGFLIAWFAFSLASKSANHEYTYGYVKAEFIGALISLFLVFGLTIWVFYEAVKRLINKDYERLDPFYMLITGILGLMINLLMGYFLHDSHEEIHSHGHSHGQTHEHVHPNKPSNIKENMVIIVSDDSDQPSNQSHEKKNANSDSPEALRTKHDIHKIHGSDKILHPMLAVDEESEPFLEKHDNQHHQDHDPQECNGQDTNHKNPQQNDPKNGNKNQNFGTKDLNMHAAWIHILGDMIVSIGIVISALIILFFPNLKFLDPAISMMFSVIAVTIGMQTLKMVISFLMDCTPPGYDIAGLSRQLENIDNVFEVHDLHIWSLSFTKIAMTVHLRAKKNKTNVLREALEVCKSNSIYHPTIQVEYLGEAVCTQNIHTEVEFK